MRFARLALVGALCLALAVPAAAIAFDTERPTGRVGIVEAPSWQSGDMGEAPSVERTAGPAAAAESRLVDRIDGILEAQMVALRTGDEARFVEAADSQARTDLGRRFRALRALRVKDWQVGRAGPLTASGGGWAVLLRMGYCLSFDECEPATVTATSRWRESGGTLKLVGLDASGSDDLGPRPWEVSELVTAVGARVTVAAVPRYAARLPAVLAAAERAAATADRYAKWEQPPERYLVYLGGSEEISRWYGLGQASWNVALAVRMPTGDSDVVLNGDKVGVGDSAGVLTHEFTHVVTLGESRSGPDNWWLSEGLADYVQRAGGPAEGIDEVRRLVRSGRWDGAVNVRRPDASATWSDAQAAYAIAYMTVRRIAQLYGEPKMLEFFAAVVRAGVPIAEASSNVLGRDWNELSAELSSYVRLTVR